MVTNWAKFFINGAWVAPADSGRQIPIYNSVTEELLETVPAGNANDVDRAVRAAHAAFPSWSALSVAERAGYLRRLAAGLRARVEQIAPLISLEVGMPIGGARGYQTIRASEFFEMFADLGESMEFEQRIGDSLVIHEPVGVVAAISPSNFPLLLTLVKLGPALITGCTVVVKPPETAPGSVFHLAEVAEEIGLPKGVINVITGYGPEAGEPLATHPLVDMISFTGSTGVGRRLLQLGSETIKRAHLELGGKSAALVLDDADLATSLKQATDQAFTNAGQVCFAWSRLVVPRSRLRAAEDILQEIVGNHRVGDPLDTETTLGPIVTSAARDRVRGYIDGAVREGARLVTGGRSLPDGIDRGYFVRPTILSDVHNGMRIAQEEVFGPVIALIPHDGDADAVRIANDSIFGLHGAVFSSDAERALGVARRMRTGQVDLNGFKLGGVAPFGGFKQSGLGRELGSFGIQEYLEVKSVQL
ncbi:aldehyde dehydrogenase family protein [Microbacterium sp. A82]|uniref:aldehyde dehydrogenase family protein n=1 Tax=Microbacterium sp. A82 TaxID=3450452 RepID=UPI003F368757